MNLYQTQHSFYCGIDLHAKDDLLRQSYGRCLKQPPSRERTLALLPSKLSSEVELEFTIKETPKPTPAPV